MLCPGKALRRYPVRLVLTVPAGSRNMHQENWYRQATAYPR